MFTGMHVIRHCYRKASYNSKIKSLPLFCKKDIRESVIEPSESVPAYHHTWLYPPRWDSEQLLPVHPQASSAASWWFEQGAEQHQKGWSLMFHAPVMAWLKIYILYYHWADIQKISSNLSWDTSPVFPFNVIIGMTHSSTAGTNHWCIPIVVCIINYCKTPLL